MGHVHTLWFDELPEEELGRTGWKSCCADVAVLMLLLCFRPGNAHQQFADAELTQAFLRLSGGRLTQAADVGTESSNAILGWGPTTAPAPRTLLLPA